MKFEIKKHHKSETKNSYYWAILVDDDGNVIERSIVSDHKALNMIVEYCKTKTVKCFRTAKEWSVCIVLIKNAAGSQLPTALKRNSQIYTKKKHQQLTMKPNEINYAN